MGQEGSQAQGCQTARPIESAGILQGPLIHMALGRVGEMAEGLWTLDCQSKAPYYLEFPRNKTNRKYRERERVVRNGLT